MSAVDEVADFHPHEVAATQLAVDREIEQRAISQSAALIEVKSNFPYLLRFHRALRADGPSGMPDLTLNGSGFSFRHLHDHSPTARVAV